MDSSARLGRWEKAPRSIIVSVLLAYRSIFVRLVKFLKELCDKTVKLFFPNDNEDKLSRAANCFVGTAPNLLSLSDRVCKFVSPSKRRSGNDVIM